MREAAMMDMEDIFRSQLERLSKAADNAAGDSMELCALTASMLDIAKFINGNTPGERTAPPSVPV